MKKILCLTCFLSCTLLITYSVYAGPIIFKENFNSYPDGSDINDPSIPGTVSGEETDGGTIENEAPSDNYAQIKVHGKDESTAPSEVAFEYKRPLPQTYNMLSFYMSIALEVRTDYSTALEKVASVAIWDNAGNSARLDDNDLLDLPLTPFEWMQYKINITELTNYWNTGISPDLRYITHVGFLLVESNTPISPLDVFNLDIDNYMIEVPEPATLLLIALSTLALLKRDKNRS